MREIVPYLSTLITVIIVSIIICGLLKINTDRYNERKKEEDL